MYYLFVFWSQAKTTGGYCVGVIAKSALQAKELADQYPDDLICRHPVEIEYTVPVKGKHEPGVVFFSGYAE